MSSATDCTGRELTQVVHDLLVETVITHTGRSLDELELTGGTDVLAVVRPPRPEMGDLAFACFPLAKALRQAPPAIAAELAGPAARRLREAAQEGLLPEPDDVAAVGPYVNIRFRADALAAHVCARIAAGAAPYAAPLAATGRTTMVEYSAPNTNKPLHLGHVRNNLLGASLCRILAAVGEAVVPVNLVNDRGIHIAKSMVAYRRWGARQTPESVDQKGDHFVGEYYVRFSVEQTAERDALARQRGLDPAALDKPTARELEEATPLAAEARDVLRRWEEGDEEVLSLWRTMNGWVYAGFDETYRRLGCEFRKWYFESETYQLGKSLVEQGLREGVFERRADGSVWAPLEAEGLKDKILLRADGTSVYITQDLGTAKLKHDDFGMDRSIYVVGSEQILHFQLLFHLLGKLGFSWAGGCHHLSYGLITLPRGLGKLKSREGRKVDADELLDELAATARRKAQEGGYVSGEDVDLDVLADAIGQGALKMYLLQVSAEKNITFDPDATLDFEGDTGPAVQYSHARICSIVRKALADGRIQEQDLILADMPEPFGAYGTGSPVTAGADGAGAREGRASEAALAKAPAGKAQPRPGTAPEQALVARGIGLRPEAADPALLTAPEEKRLVLELAFFESVLQAAAEQLSPSPLAGYLLELTKTFARFYHSCPVLKAESEDLCRARLHLCLVVAATLRRGLGLLGIEAPDAM